MTRVVVATDDGNELSIDGSDMAHAALAEKVGESLSAPGGVLTLHARNATHVIPVHAIRWVRVEPEDSRT